MQQNTCRRASCAVVVVLWAAAGSSGSALVFINSYIYIDIYYIINLNFKLE